MIYYSDYQALISSNDLCYNAHVFLDNLLWRTRAAETYEKCHCNMSDSGIRVCYNNEIHRKVLLVDDLVAVARASLENQTLNGITDQGGL